MKKVRLGLCIGDNEYSLRFTNCIMNHYQEQVELHIYSENAELKRDRKSYDIVLIDDVKNAEKWGGEVPVRGPLLLCSPIPLLVLSIMFIVL